MRDPGSSSSGSWRSLKYEEVYLRDYRDLHELERSLRRWFERYNNVATAPVAQRAHALGSLSTAAHGTGRMNHEKQYP